MLTTELIHGAFWIWLWVSVIVTSVNIASRLDKRNQPPDGFGRWVNRITLIGTYLFILSILWEGLQVPLGLLPDSVTFVAALVAAVWLMREYEDKLRLERQEWIYREAFNLLGEYLNSDQGRRMQIENQCRERVRTAAEGTDWGEISYRYNRYVLYEIERLKEKGMI